MSDPNRLTNTVRCYLDESGIERASPFIVVAGQLFSQRQFTESSRRLGTLLLRYRIERPLHMEAADVVAWAAHRQLVRGQLDDEFTSLASILSPHLEREGADPVGHLGYVVPDEAIELIAEQINEWMISNNDLPKSLTALLS